MSDFNWNDHPIVNAPSQNGAAFNWNDHPVVQAADPSWLDKSVPGGTPRGYIKSALEALPTVGMIGGGIAGAAGGGIPTLGVGAAGGGLAGAGLGAAAGESLKNIGEKYILGEDKTRGDVYGGPAKAFVQGVGAEMGGQVLGAGIKAAADTPAVQTAMGKIGSGLAKVGETFSGVPAKEIETYAKNADQIKAMAKSSDNSVSDAADQLREKWSADIAQTKASLNNQIAQGLKGSTGTVSVDPVIANLEKAKAGINETLNPEDVAQIDGIIGKIKKLAGDDNALSLSEANDVKKFLQDQATSAYKPGAIFSLGTNAANAAKSGAAAARTLVNEAAPSVAEANSKLADLHDIEDSMHINMLKDGKPEASILAAGSGGNPRNAGSLRDLGDAVGSNMLGDAQNLSAMRTFGSPKLIAQDATGKAAGRMGLASGAGYLIGNVPGAVLAAGATSPAAVKVAIDGGRVAGSALANPAAQTLIANGLNSAAASKIGQMLPAANQVPSLDSPLATKGPDKWANDGMQKLLDHVQDPATKLELQNLKDRIGDDKKGRDLLIQASDLTPGSKALDKILSQLQSKYGKDD
jgi:hypothetical protein